MPTNKKAIQKELKIALQAHSDAEHKITLAEADMERASATISLLVKKLHDLEIAEKSGGDGDKAERFDTTEPAFRPGDKVVRVKPTSDERMNGVRATGEVVGWTKTGKVRAHFVGRETPGNYNPQNLRVYVGEPPSLKQRL